MYVPQNNRCLFVTIIILSVILAVSVGCNIRFGRSVADNNRLRELQLESERTIAELTDDNRRAEKRATTAERLNREAAVIVADALHTNAPTGANLARANEIVRSVITTLQNLELLYRGSNGCGDNGLDTLGGEQVAGDGTPAGSEL